MYFLAIIEILNVGFVEGVGVKFFIEGHRIRNCILKNRGWGKEFELEGESPKLAKLLTK